MLLLGLGYIGMRIFEFAHPVPERVTPGTGRSEDRHGLPDSPLPPTHGAGRSERTHQGLPATAPAPPTRPGEGATPHYYNTPDDRASEDVGSDVTRPGPESGRQERAPR
jgi:hypothetical protein